MGRHTFSGFHRLIALLTLCFFNLSQLAIAAPGDRASTMRVQAGLESATEDALRQNLTAGQSSVAAIPITTGGLEERYTVLNDEAPLYNASATGISFPMGDHQAFILSVDNVPGDGSVYRYLVRRRGNSWDLMRREAFTYRGTGFPNVVVTVRSWKNPIASGRVVDLGHGLTLTRATGNRLMVRGARPYGRGRPTVGVYRLVKATKAKKVEALAGAEEHEFRLLVVYEQLGPSIMSSDVWNAVENQYAGRLVRGGRSLVASGGDQLKTAASLAEARQMLQTGRYDAALIVGPDPGTFEIPYVALPSNMTRWNVPQQVETAFQQLQAKVGAGLEQRPEFRLLVVAPTGVDGSKAFHAAEGWYGTRFTRGRGRSLAGSGGDQLTLVSGVAQAIQATTTKTFDGVLVVVPDAAALQDISPFLRDASLPLAVLSAPAVDTAVTATLVAKRTADLHSARGVDGPVTELLNSLVAAPRRAGAEEPVFEGTPREAALWILNEAPQQGYTTVSILGHAPSVIRGLRAERLTTVLASILGSGTPNPTHVILRKTTATGLSAEAKPAAGMEELPALTAIRQAKVMAVITPEDPDEEYAVTAAVRRTVDLALMVARTGVIPEITFRVRQGREAMVERIIRELVAQLAKEGLKIPVAVGSVSTPEQVRLAVEAEATIIVSPGFDAAVVTAALARAYEGVIVIPGVGSVEEAREAVAAGAHAVKVFPANYQGTAGFIAAVKAPLTPAERAAFEARINILETSSDATVPVATFTAIRNHLRTAGDDHKTFVLPTLQGPALMEAIAAEVPGVGLIPTGGVKPKDVALVETHGVIAVGLSVKDGETVTQIAQAKQSTAGAEETRPGGVRGAIAGLRARLRPGKGTAAPTVAVAPTPPPAAPVVTAAVSLIDDPKGIIPDQAVAVLTPQLSHVARLNIKMPAISRVQGQTSWSGEWVTRSVARPTPKDLSRLMGEFTGNLNAAPDSLGQSILTVRAYLVPSGGGSSLWVLPATDPIIAEQTKRLAQLAQRQQITVQETPVTDTLLESWLFGPADIQPGLRGTLAIISDLLRSGVTGDNLVFLRALERNVEAAALPLTATLAAGLEEPVTLPVVALTGVEAYQNVGVATARIREVLDGGSVTRVEFTGSGYFTPRMLDDADIAVVINQVLSSTTPPSKAVRLSQEGTTLIVEPATAGAEEPTTGAGLAPSSWDRESSAQWMILPGNADTLVVLEQLAHAAGDRQIATLGTAYWQNGTPSFAAARDVPIVVKATPEYLVAVRLQGPGRNPVAIINGGELQAAGGGEWYASLQAQLTQRHDTDPRAFARALLSVAAGAEETSQQRYFESLRQQSIARTGGGLGGVVSEGLVAEADAAREAWAKELLNGGRPAPALKVFDATWSALPEADTHLRIYLSSERLAMERALRQLARAARQQSKMVSSGLEETYQSVGIAAARIRQLLDGDFGVTHVHFSESWHFSREALVGDDDIARMIHQILENATPPSETVRLRQVGTTLIVEPVAAGLEESNIQRAKALGTIICFDFFENISPALVEAAIADGADEFTMNPYSTGNYIQHLLTLATAEGREWSGRALGLRVPAEWETFKTGLVNASGPVQKAFKAAMEPSPNVSPETEFELAYAVIYSMLKDREVVSRMLDEAVIAGRSGEDVYWTISEFFAKRIAEQLLPVYERTGRRSGYVSIEVDPRLERPEFAEPQTPHTSASDHSAMITWMNGTMLAQATRLSQLAPNILVKVPATPAGFYTIEHLPSANFNVTLEFTPDHPRRAIAAYEAQHTSRGAQRVLRNSPFVSRNAVWFPEFWNTFLQEADGHVCTICNSHATYEALGSYAGGAIWSSLGNKVKGDPDEIYAARLVGPWILNMPPATALGFNRAQFPVEQKFGKRSLPQILTEYFQDVKDGKVPSAAKQFTALMGGEVSPEQQAQLALAEWQELSTRPVDAARLDQVEARITELEASAGKPRAFTREGVARARATLQAGDSLTETDLMGLILQAQGEETFIIPFQGAIDALQKALDARRAAGLEQAAPVTTDDVKGLEVDLGTLGYFRKDQVEAISVRLLAQIGTGINRILVGTGDLFPAQLVKSYVHDATDLPEDLTVPRYLEKDLNQDRRIIGYELKMATYNGQRAVLVVPTGSAGLEEMPAAEQPEVGAGAGTATPVERPAGELPGDVAILPPGSQRVPVLPRPVDNGVLLTEVRASLGALQDLGKSMLRAVLGDTSWDLALQRQPLYVLDQQATAAAPGMERLELPFVVVVRSPEEASAFVKLGVFSRHMVGVTDAEHSAEAYWRAATYIETVSAADMAEEQGLARFLGARGKIAPQSQVVIVTTFDRLNELLHQNGFGLPGLAPVLATLNQTIEVVDAYLKSQG